MTKVKIKDAGSVMARNLNIRLKGLIPFVAVNFQAGYYFKYLHFIKKRFLPAKVRPKHSATVAFS